MKKIIYFQLFSFVIIIGLIILDIIVVNQKKLRIIASSQSKSLTTQTDWQEGNYDSNADLGTNPGDVKIVSEAKITEGNWQLIIDDGGSGNVDNVHDNNTATGVTLGTNGLPEDSGDYAEFNFGQNYNVKNLRWYWVDTNEVPGDIPPGIHYWDGSTWQPFPGDITGNPGQWNSLDVNPVISTAKIRAKVSAPMPGSVYYRELEAFSSPLTATHTSAPGQIGATGETDRKVVDWENFTATESEVANSAIRYRFRKTNSDGSWTGDWTDYLDYASAINLANYSQLAISQDDFANGKTYLQVETKFTRTDAAANPTVSDYSISYHTNKKPNAPTGQ